MADEYILKEYIINKCKEHRDFYISAWGSFAAMPKEDKVACDAYATIWSDVVNVEAADVVPALYGKWIERHDYIECSFCGFTVLDTYCEKRDCINGDTYFNFCPRCGAYMGEPETTKR